MAPASVKTTENRPIDEHVPCHWRQTDEQHWLQDQKNLLRRPKQYSSFLQAAYWLPMGQELDFRIDADPSRTSGTSMRGARRWSRRSRDGRGHVVAHAYRHGCQQTYQRGGNEGLRRVNWSIVSDRLHCCWYEVMFCVGVGTSRFRQLQVLALLVTKLCSLRQQLAYIFTNRDEDFHYHLLAFLISISMPIFQHLEQPLSKNA